MNQNDINSGSMLRVGIMLHGTYRIDSYLSSGGFGNTYVATNVEFNERYAIKEFFMKGVTQRDENQTTISVSNSENVDSFLQQKEKFKKEARRLRQLNNPHIVKVYDLFEENGTAYYVMDYVDGENFSERLKRTGQPMSEEEISKILPQILDALQAVHDAGFWHLDLKPANIMVDKAGQVKLIDFGASKQLNAQKGGATTSTAISYTNGYAPREQMEQNYDKFGPWTDIYALGATLYNLLTNQRPPLPIDIDDDMSEDKHLALPMPNVSSKMKQLILWMMRTNRMLRPKIILEIEQYVESEKKKESVTKEFSVKKDSQQGTEEETIVATQNYVQPKGKLSDADSSDSCNQNDDNIEDNTEKPNYLWVKIVVLSACLLLGGIWYYTSNRNKDGVWTVETVPMVHLQDSLCYVSDPEDLIEPVYQQKCDSLMRLLENEFGIESAVVVVNRIEGEISKFATDLGNYYGIGDKDRNRGLCIVLAYEQHQIHIGTGTGLESEMTDSICGDLLETCSVPYLKIKKTSIAIYNLCQGIVSYFSSDKDLYVAVDVMPSFPGGQNALMQWLSSNIKYPAIPAKNGVQGRVIVQFVVEKDGSLSGVTVVRAADPSLDKEAQRVVKSMPKWVPGKQNGVPVRVMYTIPITFKLK